MKSKNENKLQFSVKFEGKPKDNIPVAAHVFDNVGNHLETTDVDKAGL